LIPAGTPGFKFPYRDLIDYLSTQLDKLGVTVELSKEATAEDVKKAAPDVLFVATGSRPIIPDIPGVDKDNVSTATDVLVDGRKVGKSVVIIGGGIVGCETALHLALEGRQVTIVEILNSVARDMFFANRMHMLELLEENGVKILTETSVAEIKDDGVVLADKDYNRSDLAADTVVLALGLSPNKALEEAMADTAPETFFIGDCVATRKVINAVWEGFRYARLV